MKIPAPNHPLTADIPDAEPEAIAGGLAGFLTRDLSAELESATLELLVRFVAVYRFRGRSTIDGGERSGWIVGGNMPFLSFNDNEIATPIEALALYSWFLYPWLDAKRNPTEDPSLPVYRVPPDWSPVTFSPGYEEWQMGAVTGFISWKLLPANASEILHPEIRARCLRRGSIPAEADPDTGSSPESPPGPRP